MAGVSLQGGRLGHQQVELVLIDAGQDVGVAHGAEQVLDDLTRVVRVRRGRRRDPPEGEVAWALRCGCRVRLDHDGRDREPAAVPPGLVDLPAGDVDVVGERVSARRRILHRCAAGRALAFAEEGERRRRLRGEQLDQAVEERARRGVEARCPGA